MSSSNEVFALRKEGKIDEAYTMALGLMQQPQRDDWDISAYAWCLIDLIKRAAKENRDEEIDDYLVRLENITVSEENHILSEQRKRALNFAKPDRRSAFEAHSFSKNKQYEAANKIYEDLYVKNLLEPEDKESWRWDLYKLISEHLPEDSEKKLPANTLNLIKHYLNNYLKVKSNEPSLIHSLMITQALKLYKKDQLKMIPFLRLWNPDLFRDDDMQSQIGKDNKTYPSLMEKIIRAATSEAKKNSNMDDKNFIIGPAKAAVKRFPDNIWLKFDLTKLLASTSQIEEAWNYAIEFVREKTTEYWAWEILGDLAVENKALALSCYAKALCCSRQDEYLSKTRIKFAKLLYDKYPQEAKFEVERVISFCDKTGSTQPRDIEQLKTAAWFLAATPKTTSDAFYQNFIEAAEELLFSHLPWVEGILGEMFTIPEKNGQKAKKRCKIYIKSTPLPLELVVQATRTDIGSLQAGAPLSVQYEVRSSKVHRIKPRTDGQNWDIFSEKTGIIDHINKEKKLIHVLVSKTIEGTYPLSNYNGKPKIGDVVAVKLAQSVGKKDTRTNIVAISPSSQKPPADIFDYFEDSVVVTDNGFGFTEGDIFIPTDIITKTGIESGDLVKGAAVASFNKKKNIWGMKTIYIISINGEKLR